MSSEPIVVFYKSSVCGYCKNLSAIWDKVQNVIKSVYPKMRFYVLTSPTNAGEFDENISPKDLKRWAAWFPMVLLVPGNVWDAAMKNLGPKNPIEITDGVQALNAIWDTNNKLTYRYKYDISKPESFSNWIKESLQNEDFKKVQFSSEEVKKTPTQPIQSLLSGIISPLEKQNPIDVDSEPEKPPQVCSIKIISRRR
jgi:hypothetical protein